VAPPWAEVVVKGASPLEGAGRGWVERALRGPGLESGPDRGSVRVEMSPQTGAGAHT
jgi:hypothetical protein